MSMEPENPVLVAYPLPHVALVTLNRPAVHNAVNGALARGLEAAIQATEQNDEIRAVVLTGAGGRSFCAGADLQEIAEGRIRDLVTRNGGFAGIVRAQRRKPWIAAIIGNALAGGTEIALSCDMIVASDTARFGLPEVKRGLAAVAGGLHRLPRALPPALAIEAITTGDPIDVRQAAAYGMVNRVLPADQVLQAALDLATRIAANAPVAVRESLAIARAALDAPADTLFAHAADAGKRLAATEDYREGPRAFLEKRAPRWLGR